MSALREVAESLDAHMGRVKAAIPALLVMAVHAAWWLYFFGYSLWRHETAIAIFTALFSVGTVVAGAILVRSLKRRQ